MGDPQLVGFLDEKMTMDVPWLPSGKLPHNYGKSPCLMGKLTISMAIFNSYVSHYQRLPPILGNHHIFLGGV